MTTPLRRAHDALRENAIGGEARGVVLDIATLLGLDLTRNPLDGDTWSVQNMARVTRAVADLKYQNAVLRGIDMKGPNG